MTKPEISVIMPVHNGEKYLAEAIDSILNQSFIDFEFIIIDDGSTDHTIDIVRKYDDPRIILIINEYNLGIAKSINKGINLARGKYIARMDCDDISLPERLVKQITFLEKNPSICVVACRAGLIDSNGNDLRMCLSEPQTIEEIKTQLPRINCIVHPSVMIRADVAKTYQYNEKMVTKRRDYEDYELWLRLISDNHKIAKSSEILIKHRMHSESFMGGIDYIPNRSNIIRTKTNFILNRFRQGDFSWFNVKVTYCMILDIVYWITSPLINKLKIVFKNILVCFGKGIGILSLFRNNSSKFFFFSCDHCEEIKLLNNIMCDYRLGATPWIFCTNKTKRNNNNLLINQHIYNISPLIKYAIIKYIIIGIISAIINRNKNAIVIGSNSLFFYNLILYLKPEIITIELLFGLEVRIEEAMLLVIERLNVRIVNNPEITKYLQIQYSFRNMKPQLIKRIIIAPDISEVVLKLITDSYDLSN